MLSNNNAIAKKTYFDKGTFGKVYRIYSPKHQDYLAAKVIGLRQNEESSKNKTLAMITRELYAWNTLTKSDCEYNNKLLDYGDKDDETFVFYSKFHPKGALSAHYKNKYLVDQVKILKEVAKGIKECHDNDICHSDIKMENVLITEEGKHILTDYGNSDVCENETVGLQVRRGTMFYMAPEVLLKNYGKNTDVWSLGILAYTLFTYGEYHPIFRDERNKYASIPYNKAVDIILNGDIHMPENMPTHLITDFLEKTIVRDSNERLTINEVLSHPLLRL